MAATYTYYYTVEAWLNWNDILTDDGLAAVSIEGNNNYPDWIQVHRESESTSAVKWTIEKGSQLQYRIRFYLKVAGDTTTPSNNGIWWLRDNVVSNVHVSSTFSSKLKIGKVNTDHHSFKPTTIYSGNASLKNTNGDTFWFSLEAKEDSFTMTNPFTITADIVNDNQVGGDVSNATKHATLKGINPIIVVSKAIQTPRTPSVFQDALTGSGEYAGNKNLASSGSGGAAPRAYNRCTKKWVGLNISSVYTKPGKPGKAFYTFTRVECGTNGTNIKIGTKYEEEKPGANVSGGGIDGPKLAAARKEIVNALIANCSDAASGGGGGGGGGGSETPKITAPPTADLRWNPPPHITSRNLPFGVTMESLQASLGKAANPNLAAYESMLRKAERGRIFQDALGASILNTNPDKLKSVSALEGAKQWGFRFMYNPTSFSYNSSSNNNVDWTLGASDPTILLSGNANVSVELYLNRIADMSYLRDYITGQVSAASLSSSYGRELKDEEIKGILHRGTEYDIEFLYRVLNGDPLKNPLLFDPYYDGVTADFGYTTAVPCWMYLNENLRYYGSVASFQVNHVMFDLNMVPMLTVVGINFARYPALWGTNKGETANSVFGKDNVSQSGFTKSLIAGTGNE